MLVTEIGLISLRNRGSRRLLSSLPRSQSLWALSRTCVTREIELHAALATLNDSISPIQRCSMRYKLSSRTYLTAVVSRKMTLCWLIEFESVVGTDTGLDHNQLVSRSHFDNICLTLQTFHDTWGIVRHVPFYLLRGTFLTMEFLLHRYQLISSPSKRNSNTFPRRRGRISSEFESRPSELYMKTSDRSWENTLAV